MISRSSTAYLIDFSGCFMVVVLFCFDHFLCGARENEFLRQFLGVKQQLSNEKVTLHEPDSSPFLCVTKEQ